MHKIKTGVLSVAAALAALAFTAVPVKAEISINAGAGLVVIAPLTVKSAGTAAVIKTDEDFTKEPAADKTVEEDKTEVKAEKAEQADDEITKALLSDVSVSGDSDEMAVIDASSVASGDQAQESEDTQQDAQAESGEQVVLSVGAGNVIPDADLFSEADMADEFAEEDAAGGAFGYTHLGVCLVDDHLNVRATAEGGKIVGKMENEAGCEILDVKGNMAHITSGSVEGYVSLDYLITGPEAVEYASTVVKEQATVTADGLKLRQDKSVDAPVYNMVAYGEQLEVFEKDDEWVGVKYDGHKLYVSAQYVSVGTQLKTAMNMTEFLYGSGVSDVRMELCEYAKQFVGNPYVWGGTSLTKGCDCSGFVLSVYKKYGISLPHSSRAQAVSGTRISMAEARPGDLVFYAKGKRINHVGIYIGGGQIVNASSPRTGIRIANAYYRTPVAVVRILQD